jgi:transmembrane sensor
MSMTQLFSRHEDPARDEDPAFALARKQAREWVARLQSGQATAEDAEAFKAWRAQSPVHAKAWAWTVEDARRVAPLMQAFGARHPARVAVPRGAPMRRRFFIGAAGAFGALALVGVVRPPWNLWPSWSELNADYRTATGEQRDVRLGESLLVSMNTQTSIAVMDGGGQPDIVLISGEAAVFARAGTCGVTSGDARVLLNQAGVEVRKLASGRVRVRCLEGRAQVLHARGATVELSAGQQLHYDSQGMEGLTRLPAQAAGWREGMVVFDNLPLAEVIDEINRYRPGRVVLTNEMAGKRRFSAKFSIANLDDAIGLLESAYGLQVRKVGEFMILS